MFVLFIGTAGSGKTTLVNSFNEYLKSIDVKTKVVNLDPAVEYLPYKPDLDIRNKFTVEKIMIEEKVGPNHAQVLAMEKLARNVEEILDPIAKSECDIVLVDTPGQMEVFAFREAGPKVAEYLAKNKPTTAVYLIDCALSKKISEIILSLMYSKVIELRLGAPVITVINKIDLLGEKKERLKEIIETLNPNLIREEVLKETSGVIAELAIETAEIILKYKAAERIIPISALKSENLDELYYIINEVFCTCGDLT